MKKVMHMLFLSCLKATELIEKRILFKLSVKEKLQLKLHKSMCNACRLYEKQSSILNEAMVTEFDYESLKLDMDDFKTHLLHKIEKLK